MDDQNTKSSAAPDIFELPELRRSLVEPKGVLRKNLKVFLYLGAALLVIVAAIFSSGGKKPSAQQDATKGQPPQPAVQDNTDNNVADLRNQLQAEKLKEQEQAAAATNAAMIARATPAQQSAAAAYDPTGQALPCAPGQTCPPATYGQQNSSEPQLSPEQQQAQQLAAKERELAYNARFASNLAYSRGAEAQPPQLTTHKAVSSNEYVSQQNPYTTAAQPDSSLTMPRAAGSPTPVPVGQSSIKHGPEVNIDSAAGQPYVIYEGLTMDTVLMNRLDGDAVGPVKVLVSNPVYSHDHQHVLIPDGTIVLGEARKIGSSGFGQQRRMAVVFHRMIMPDGYSVDLNQFHGLDQIGEEGLKDKVNNHYLQIFGTSIALGIVAGAGEIAQGGGTFAGSGSQQFTNGASASISQSATTILDRFIQIPPNITIREGHRVKVYFTQDMLLPAYENHTIPQTL
ncbi:type IV secretion system protein VirB10 [Acidipila rosea]|uniref:Type IV secretion system protein VirB10 n=1 Tax=Acidipila rosea TaxID=768535 RepID=A0A4R1KYW1_9BACT|nr:type IV secretion system protein VirB10 [Acidipila rosea]